MFGHSVPLSDVHGSVRHAEWYPSQSLIIPRTIHRSLAGTARLLFTFLQDDLELLMDDNWCYGYLSYAESTLNRLRRNFKYRRNLLFLRSPANWMSHIYSFIFLFYYLHFIAITFCAQILAERLKEVDCIAVHTRDGKLLKNRMWKVFKRAVESTFSWIRIYCCIIVY